MQQAEPMQRGGSGITALLVLLWIGWVLCPLSLLAASYLSLITFFGDPVTPDQERASVRYLVAAAVVAVVLPLCGWVVSRRTGRRGQRRGFGVAAAVAALAVGVALVVWLDSRPAGPVERGEPVCQEHSGGDTRCPGG